MVDCVLWRMDFVRCGCMRLLCVQCSYLTNGVGSMINWVCVHLVKCWYFHAQPQLLLLHHFPHRQTSSSYAGLHTSRTAKVLDMAAEWNSSTQHSTTEPIRMFARALSFIVVPAGLGVKRTSSHAELKRRAPPWEGLLPSPCHFLQTSALIWLYGCSPRCVVQSTTTMNTLCAR